VKEKHVKTKYRSAGILFNDKVLKYFKVYFFIIVNFHTSLGHICLNSKCRISKTFHEKMAAARHIVTSLLLKSLKQTFTVIISFGLSKWL
jgi:hypothetical protein